jgi:hypothetical protein
MEEGVTQTTYKDFVAIEPDADEIMKVRARMLCEEQAKDIMLQLGVKLYRIEFVEQLDYMKWTHAIDGKSCRQEAECQIKPGWCRDNHWFGVTMPKPQRLLMGWKVELEDKYNDEQNDESATTVEPDDIHGTDISGLRDTNAGDPMDAGDVDGTDSPPPAEEVPQDEPAGGLPVEADDVRRGGHNPEGDSHPEGSEGGNRLGPRRA